MANRSRTYVFLILLLAAAAIVVGIFFTSPQEQTAGQSRGGRQLTPMSRLVNQQSLQTAQQLDKLATTREEARYSREAVRVADHEVDLAFTSALRKARIHPPPETSETKQLNERVRELQAQVASAQEDLKKLDSEVPAARGNAVDELQDRRQLLAAELALRQNELDDAKRDLMRAGGDDESRIQRLFSTHENAQHNEQAQPVPFQAREVFQMPGNTVAQVRLMWQLNEKRKSLLNAKKQSVDAAAELSAKHDEMEKTLDQAPAGVPTVARNPEQQSQKDSASVLALRILAEDRKLLSEYDQRVQDHQQLAQLYGDWATLLQARIRACLHAVLQGLLWIVGIVGLVLLGNIAVDRLSHRFATDRRRMATMRLLGHFVMQGIGLVLIIFVLVGPPNQLSTVIALAGAGLTVALKDFIVAFFGWFVLMGKNGIRVGDWVEINGIGGEVVEIGLLRTVLLEVGNWADSGHPTGRRVTFVNSFAIEGHYFNFSTTGQWLWDSLEVLVPSGQDPYPITESLLELVKAQSESNAREAEKEWRRATRDYGMQSFSAEPALNLRPTAQGTNVIVRYITRASERYAVRTHLYQQVVDLLRRKDASARVQVQAGPS